MNAFMLTQWPEDKLYNYVEDALDSLDSNKGIIFTSGGAMPVECTMERLASIGKGLAPYLTL